MPDGSVQLSLFGEPASNGKSPASPSSPQGNLFAEFTDRGTESEKSSNLACLDNSIAELLDMIDRKVGLHNTLFFITYPDSFPKVFE